MLSYGSVCSGIEAASVAWEPLGFTPEWFAEIEEFPSAVLKHHWPHIENLGDMTKIAERVTRGEISSPDVLVGGTPCQAFSVAGLRKGLADERGQLTISYVGLLDAIDQQRKNNGQPECVAVWENVPGVLTSKDNAFGCFLGLLSGEQCALEPSGRKWPNAGFVHGPQRSIAWRVFDAQYFGVAQRRRRVFLVASARNDVDPGQILFEFDRLRRDIAPSREPRKDVTADVTQGVDGQSGGVTFFDAYQHHGWREADTTGTLTANLSRGVCGDTPLAAHTKTYGLPGNWIGRKPENGGNAVEPMHNITPCQTRTDRHDVAYPTLTQYGVEMAGTLTARFDSSPCHDRGQNMVGSFGMAVRRLLPVECERLQGFPDNHTLIPYRGKAVEQCPDGQRYKALGNSMAVPCMRWIGQRIKGQLNKV